MQTVPTFTPPILKRSSRSHSRQEWEKSLQEYTQGKFHSSISSIIRYLDPSLIGTNDTVENRKIGFNHGSVKVYLETTSDTFEISCPFVELPEKAKVVILRKASELNMTPLILSQMILKGNKLYFSYKDKIELSHPSKILNILDEVARNADHLDDFFIERFNAKPIEKATTQPLSPEDLTKVVDFFQSHVKQVIDNINYAEQKSMYELGWDMTYVGIQQLMDTANPYGFIAKILSDMILILYSKSDFPTKLQQVKKQLQDLLALPKEKISECYYEATFLIPGKEETDLQTIQNTLGNSVQKALQYRQKGIFENATSYMLVDFYYVMKRYLLPTKIEKKIRECLMQISGKSWKDASDVLLQTVDNINRQTKETLAQETGSFGVVDQDAYMQMMKMAAQQMEQFQKMFGQQS